MNIETEGNRQKADAATPKILIIDDDPFQIQLLEKIFNQENYLPIGYADNIKALEEVAEIAPDLIVLDLIMPGIDGFEVCRRLKADERTRDIPIIFVTARKDQLTESKGFELGAVDYITKPFHPTIVKARIRTHLELKKHRDALELLVYERTAERDKSQQQFQDLVEKSLVGIAIIKNGQVVYQNPELTRTVADLARKVELKDFSFVHPDDLPQLIQAYDGLMNRRELNVEVDIRLLGQKHATGAGHVKWMNCRASQFNYQDGEAILINIVDITHTKELERLLLIRNKMASLGRIAAGMAHEIRNPLTGITSYLYTLEQMCELETLLPKDIDLMGQIISQLKLASHKVDAVIKRVLDFSKPTAPRMVRIDINQCLKNVHDLTAVTMRKAEIEVTYTLAENLPKCYGDVALIEQVFLNLIQNAGHAVRHARDKKMVTVTSYSEKNQICVTVSDSGPGVPDDLKEKIFDPFFTTTAEGSGIGLSIAQRIVADHNGMLSLQSTDVGGAKFMVALPIEKRKFKR